MLPDHEAVQRFQEVYRKSRQIWNGSWDRESGSAEGMVSGRKTLDVEVKALIHTVQDRITCRAGRGSQDNPSEEPDHAGVPRVARHLHPSQH